MSTIGVFLRACVNKEKRSQENQLLNSWMASHLSKEGIEKIIREGKIEEKRQAAKEDFQAVKSEWVRLANFMRSQR